jgi:predicted TIM-barrel fold metal-dependent hydrolase
MNRREWIIASAGTLAAQTKIDAKQQPPAQRQKPSEGLPLEQFQPQSMLHLPETKVPRSRYPVIDMHTHLTTAYGLSGKGGLKFHATPEECLGVMDPKNIRALVDLTGGYGDALKQALATFQEAHPGRFLVFTEPAYSHAADPGYPQFQADQIEAAHKAGAKGLKVLKTLGLYLREHITEGKLVRVDDPRFDPMWEAAGALHMPVCIHTSDPEAFFRPIDRFNERWEELHAHPDWSFYGKDFPTNRELQEARRNVMRRHPQTQFVCLHVADAEDLAYVSECMDSHPNMSVDIAARIGELGRQPRTARKFFDRYQDRIVFGTDASPKGFNVPQQLFGDALYEIYYRFLESDDEYFDYAPAAIPPQGRWKIYGLALPDSILRKLYFENAARLLHLASA